MDHDTYSAGSLIGTVVIDLNTMVMRSDYDNSLSPYFDGWMPIYDTMEGIRGELYITVSSEAKGDRNVCILSVDLLASNLKKVLRVFLYLLVVVQTSQSIEYVHSILCLSFLR